MSSPSSSPQPPEHPPAASNQTNPPDLQAAHLRSRPRRRIGLPLVLFVATCLSTYWAGATNWQPQSYMHSSGSMWEVMATNWRQGLTYMGAVLAILLTHEMGHFLQTLRYHIPASYPLCIPMPSLIGTMGAVISMDGMRAHRKQIFDIGIAGPLAGLVVAFPILYVGITRLDLSIAPGPHDIQLYNPVIVRWMIEWIHPEWVDRANWVAVSQLNPFFMAGWVGMLITGLNMLPVSQLDGGHTIYAFVQSGAGVCDHRHRVCRAEPRTDGRLDADADPGDPDGHRPSAHGRRHRGARRLSLDPGRGVDVDPGALLSAVSAEAVDPFAEANSPGALAAAGGSIN